MTRAIRDACRRMLAALGAGAIAWLASMPMARSHDANMAVLQLEETQPGQFLSRWVITAGGAGIDPVYPDHCRLAPPLVDCGAAGLVGEVSLPGLGGVQSAAVLRVVYRNGATLAFTLTPAQPTASIAADLGGEGIGTWLRVGSAYVVIGIEHILLGIDHLLFVLGLMWIVRERWMLVKTITAFTLAHSVTLAAATFGWVGVPERAVNAIIALSIVFVGVEMLRQLRGEGGLATRHPWVVAFAFGLLHGFGFANALVKLGLPSSTLPLGLLAFNVGVEIGQIAFVFLVLGLGWSLRVMLVRWPRWSEPAPAYAVGGIAAFWLFDRMTILLTA